MVNPTISNHQHAAILIHINDNSNATQCNVANDFNNWVSEKCRDQWYCRKRSRDRNKTVELLRICLIVLRHLIGCICNIVDDYGRNKHTQAYSMSLHQQLSCALHICTHENSNVSESKIQKFLGMELRKWNFHFCETINIHSWRG